MKTYTSILNAAALFLLSFGAFSGDRPIIKNPYVPNAVDPLEITVLDPGIEYTMSVDEAFNINNNSLYYKAISPVIVDKFKAEMPQPGDARPVELPKWYKFYPLVVMRFSGLATFAYDGCYVRGGNNAYYVASKTLGHLIREISFFDVDGCPGSR